MANRGCEQKQQKCEFRGMKFALTEAGTWEHGQAYIWTRTPLQRTSQRLLCSMHAVSTACSAILSPYAYLQTHTHTHLKVYQAWTGMHTVAAELGSKRSCTGKLHWICKQEICSLEQGTLGLEQGSAWTCHCGCCCSRIVPHKGVRGPFESSHTIHERSSFREKSLPFAMIEMVRVEWQPCA